MFRDHSEIKSAACEEYQELLKKSHTALRECKDGRMEIRRTGRKGRPVDNELRLLQANFARAYTALQSHARDCTYCQTPVIVRQGFGTNPVAHDHPLHQ